VSDETEANDSEDDAAEQSGDPTRYGAPLSDSFGQAVVHPSRDSWLEVASEALADRFDHLTGVTAVDFLTYGVARDLPAGIEPERFEVVALISNISSRERIRLRVQVPEDDPTLPSLFDLWPGSETPEREVYDMFGITFVDHPDMCRVLMPDDWVGHPLRKDFAVGRIPVQFKAEGTSR